MTARGAAPSAATLLRNTLADPFGPHVRDWVKCLVTEFPLWSFQKNTFAALHSGVLPTTYPLPRFVESILADEGIQRNQPLDPLEGDVDQRRRWVADMLTSEPAWLHDGSGGTGLLGGHNMFRPDWTSDLVEGEPDTEYSGGGYISPYEDIGRDLVPLIEDVQFAPGKRERETAQRALDDYLQQLGAKLGPHRAREGPGSSVLKTIAAEGTKLIELCWNVLPYTPTSITATVLAQYGVPAAAQAGWVPRLTLPVFSSRELEALEKEATGAAQWRRGQGPYPTPKRFVVWLIAHRLHLQPTSVARTLRGSHGVEYFRRQSPIS